MQPANLLREDVLKHNAIDIHSVKWELGKKSKLQMGFEPKTLCDLLILTMWMFDAALAKHPHTGMSPLLNIELPV